MALIVPHEKGHIATAPPTVGYNCTRKKIASNLMTNIYRSLNLPQVDIKKTMLFFK